MRVFIFPRGQTYHAPSDPLSQQMVDQILHPTITRDRLTDGIYRTVEPTNALGLLHEAMVLAETAEPLEKRIRVDGVKTGRVTALDLPGQIQQALAAGILSETEAAMLRDYDRRVMDIINVDDFDTEELAAGQQPVELRSVRVSNA
jgi:acyl-CoA dehydrogenase